MAALGTLRHFAYCAVGVSRTWLDRALARTERECPVAVTSAPPTLGTGVKDRRVAASECHAVQVDLVLIGPQHGSGFAPKQQTLHSLAKSLSLEVECVVNLACTKTPSNLVYDQPTMAVVYFCHSCELAPKQLTPGRKDLVIRFAKTKRQVGTGTFDASEFGPTNMKTADFLQYLMRGVKLGHSAGHAKAASQFPAGSRK